MDTVRFNKPLVSVLLPVSGEGWWLEESLKSISSQTFRGFECVIVLDRPSKRARNISEEFARNDSRFRVLESSSPGLPSALNLGWNQSAGALIARMDSDDVMVENRLALQLSAFEADEKLCILGSQVLFINAEGNRLGRSALPLSSKEISRQLPWTNPLVHPTLMFRRDCMKFFAYDVSMPTGEDYDLLLKANLAGLRMRNLSEILLYYRRSDLQMTANAHRQLRLQFNLSARIARQFFPEMKNFIHARNALHIFLSRGGVIRFICSLRKAPTALIPIIKCWLMPRVELALAWARRLFAE